MKPILKCTIYILLLFLTFGSCKQPTDPNTNNNNGYDLSSSGLVSIVGQVVDYTDSAIVPYANVSLIAQSQGSIGIGSGYGSVIADTVADADGKFLFSFYKETKTYYSLAAKADRYFESNSPTDIKKPFSGEVTKVRIQPKAVMKVHVKKLKPSGANEINFNSPGIRSFYGYYIDAIEYATVYGNMENKVIYFLYTSNVRDTVISTKIYCPKFDTTYYEVLY